MRYSKLLYREVVHFRQEFVEVNFRKKLQVEVTLFTSYKLVCLVYHILVVNLKNNQRVQTFTMFSFIKKKGERLLQ